MTDEPNRWNGLLANLLAMKDLPWAPTLSRRRRITRSDCPRHRLMLCGLRCRAKCAMARRRSLATKSLDSMTQDELDEVYDAAHSALMNAAPIVRSYTARQDKGTYPVWIAGIEGVYLLMASEHDTLGPFATLAHAVDAMDRSYGRFLVGD
jgi:hypothetical protein